jgi:hypothetical protein
MSKGYRYSGEFKQEAVNQVTVLGYTAVALLHAKPSAIKGCTTGLRSFSNRLKTTGK